jgi:hypothetical protein
MKILNFLVLCASASLSAQTVRLFNDSPYKLRAVVRGADGTQLGEVDINAHQALNWDSGYSVAGPYQNRYSQMPNASQTPYSVLWYCVDGSSYSICEIVPPGSTVNAQGCNGNKICKSLKRSEPCQCQPPKSE